MNEFCQCSGPGFCNRHNITKGPERFARCKGVAGTKDCGLSFWNAWEEGKLGATAPEDPKMNPSGFCSKESIFVSNIGDKLSAIIKEESGIDTPCGECKQRILELNMMTKEQASTNIDAIVDDLYKRAWEKANIFQKVIIGIDSLLHTKFTQSLMREWVERAISESEDVKKKYRQRDVAHVHKPLTSMAKPLKYQDELFKLSENKPIRDEFSKKPIVNLVWHIWPKSNWRWHVANINDLVQMCDGKKIIGISYDDETADPEEVKSLIKGDVEFLINKNIGGNDLSQDGQRYGELATLIPAVDMLKDTGDSVTVYGHCKGQRDHTKDSLAVKLWTEMMYETVSFNIEKTIEEMNNGYKCFGSFRTFGYKPLKPNYRWHYSGSFFNFRTKYMIGKPFQLKYGGSEAWLGDHVPINESYCSFADNSPWLRQYSDELMKNLISSHLIWTSESYGDVKVEQHVRELNWLFDNIKDVKSMLIIGSRYGGLESQISKRRPDIRLLSMDINPSEGNKIENMIVGDSHDESIQNKILEYGDFDSVFIDGDHTYEGVKMDFDFAKKLNPNVVFFHDHSPHVYHEMCGSDVTRLWNEIVKEYETSEKSVGCGWGGIGAVWMRNKK